MLISQQAPVPWPAGAEPCPACGRPLTGAIKPGYKPKPMGGPLKPTEAIEDLQKWCVVDGPLGEGLTAGDVTTEEAVAFARHCADECANGGEHRWARMLDKAADSGDRDHVCHALAALHRRGPLHYDAIRIEDQALRQMILDISAAWPTSGNG